MKVYLDCFPCFMRQALDAARMATDDLSVQREVLDRVARVLPAVPLDATPVEIGQKVHRTVREITGVADPYRAVKKKSNDIGVSLYPGLKARVERAADPLLAAIKIAGAGNIIDFGPKVKINFDSVGFVNDALAAPVDEGAYRVFTEKLQDADRILYIGDNAGEIVCDKILIEILVSRGKSVTFVTRGSPTLNDVTLEDAFYVGIDKLAEVITTGSDAPGIVFSDASPEFISAFRKASFVISKGQGNYEGLSDVDGSIFFLFKVKCPVIARDAGAEIGSVVLKWSGADD